MIKKFVERPVLAAVISILLVIMGVLGLSQLSLQMFPDIAPPAVQVTAVYPGANAETLLRSVAPSLEEAVNGVEDMVYMNSTASNDGSLVLTVFFKLGTDPDQAAVNVQNRVSQAQSQLPPEVLQQGITTVKQQNSNIMSIDLYSEDAEKYDETFLVNYAQINIIPEIKRIPGVGSAIVTGGNKDYSMRIWLNPQKMANYNLTTKELMAVIQDKNLEAAPGRLGESSTESFEYIIKYKGKLNRPEDYENMIIRSDAGGSVLRLKDVARVEFGASTYGSHTSINGKPGFMIGIFQQAGSNANDIQVEIKKIMDRKAKSFPKEVKYLVLYSTKETLDESITQVIHTLIEAFLLVFIVVYLFLQDFRSTLIPAIAVPVAIIGTFFFMYIFGFSINLLTLFALVLAIGIVVDDAIVVVEAVHGKMEKDHLDAKSATMKAMSEISGAIVSITLIMAAVFLPVGFLKGSTGVFYQQFAFTMAIAIVISAVNALTLTPALAALFLKNVHVEEADNNKKGFAGRFFRGFNGSFDRMTRRYTRGLSFLIKNKWWSIAGLCVIITLTVVLMDKSKKGFIPSEDQGFIAVAVSLPPGASLERNVEVSKETEKALLNEPYLRVLSITSGLNLLTQTNSPSHNITFVLLKPKKDRGDVQDINEIVTIIQNKLSVIKNAEFFVFTFPTVPGFGNVEGLDLVLQDKSGSGDLNKLGTVGQEFISELMKRPEIAVAFSTFQANYPQYELKIDDEKAELLQVSTSDILKTMQATFGGMQASDFNRFGKYYRVMLQADIHYRNDLSSLDGVFVKNKAGESVPINTLVSMKRSFGPETASRYNLFNSMQINAIPKPGFSTGDAIRAITEVADNKLPAGYGYEFSGITKEEISSGGQSLIIFLLCVVFVYFLLAAQYESFVLPLAVILSIPTGIFGVFVTIGLAGIDNNIYVQIALIMLIGLLAKNAILIVEFASQRRSAGMSITSSAIEAAKSRIRPIIMTSLAFIVGLIPMVFATGPSAQGNQSISIGAIGGMLTGVLLGVLIIPVLYVIFQNLQERISGKKVDDLRNNLTK